MFESNLHIINISFVARQFCEIALRNSILNFISSLMKILTFIKLFLHAEVNYYNEILKQIVL